MDNITGAVTGFSYHAYPAGDGHNLEALLLNSSWLRHGILTGARSDACLAYWNSGPRARGMRMWVTEASSSWNWPGGSPPWPPGMPAQNSFLHGFFSLPQWGQYAATGVEVVARWALALGGSFATLDFDTTHDRWDVAADFWLIVAHKRLLGGAVLDVAGDDVLGSDALVYATCARRGASFADLATPPQGGGGSNGSVTVMAVNPSLDAIELTLNVPAAPRWEYVFTAPGGNLSALTSVLNGGPPLRINADGSLPPLPGRFVGASDINARGITLPPQSQVFVVLLGAGVSDCSIAAAADTALAAE